MRVDGAGVVLGGVVGVLGGDVGGGVVLGLGDDVGGGVVSDVVDHGVVDYGGVVMVLGVVVGLDGVI